MPPKKRNKENKPLPERWRLRRGKYWYRVPPGLEHEWDNKKEFLLGLTLSEAYKVWAERIQPSTADLRTMSQVFDRYLLEVIPEKAFKTQESNLISIRKLRPVFEMMQPQNIKPSYAYKYHDVTAKKRGKTAARHDIQVLRHVLTKCVEWGVIDLNPLMGQIRLEGGKPRTRLVEDWEITECLNLKPKIKSRAVVLAKLYIQLKLMTGLSRIDLLQLKLSDLKEDGIHSQRQKTKNTTGKRLIIIWTDELIELIEEIKQLSPYRIGDVYLFVTRLGKPYFNPETMKCNAFDSLWQRFMQRVMTLTKVTERFHEHDLRAKAASDSETLEEASERLGHATTETTKRVYRRKPTTVTPLKRKS